MSDQESPFLSAEAQAVIDNDFKLAVGVINEEISKAGGVYEYYCEVFNSLPLDTQNLIKLVGRKSYPLHGDDEDMLHPKAQPIEYGLTIGVNIALSALAEVGPDGTAMYEREFANSLSRLYRHSAGGGYDIQDQLERAGKVTGQHLKVVAPPELFTAFTDDLYSDLDALQNDAYINAIGYAVMPAETQLIYEAIYNSQPVDLEDFDIEDFIAEVQAMPEYDPEQSKPTEQ